MLCFLAREGVHQGTSLVAFLEHSLAAGVAIVVWLPGDSLVPAAPQALMPLSPPNKVSDCGPLHIVLHLNKH